MEVEVEANDWTQTSLPILLQNNLYEWQCVYNNKKDCWANIHNSAARACCPDDKSVFKGQRANRVKETN